MELYSYFRSTAAYRVRIALNLKGLDYDILPVHLLRDGGQQKSADYLAKNPDGLVPALATEDQVLSQSIAILEYLEETYPNPALLPEHSLDRAYVRAIAQSVACDIHPLNNLRVLQYLTNTLAVNDEQKKAWYHHWVATGFSSIETRLARESRAGLCCFGDSPTLADACLIPQVYNAKRFDCPLHDYPTILRINDHCLTLDAFDAARPEHQPDAE
jgi:maleylacetoacetate isomerase